MKIEPEINKSDSEITEYDDNIGSLIMYYSKKYGVVLGVIAEVSISSTGRFNYIVDSLTGNSTTYMRSAKAKNCILDTSTLEGIMKIQAILLADEFGIFAIPMSDRGVLASNSNSDRKLSDVVRGNLLGFIKAPINAYWLNFTFSKVGGHTHQWHLAEGLVLEYDESLGEYIAYYTYSESENYTTFNINTVGDLVNTIRFIKDKHNT